MEFIEQSLKDADDLPIKSTGINNLFNMLQRNAISKLSLPDISFRAGQALALAAHHEIISDDELIILKHCFKLLGEQSHSPLGSILQESYKLTDTKHVSTLALNMPKLIKLACDELQLNNLESIHYKGMLENDSPHLNLLPLLEFISVMPTNTDYITAIATGLYENVDKAPLDLLFNDVLGQYFDKGFDTHKALIVYDCICSLALSKALDEQLHLLNMEEPSFELINSKTEIKNAL